MVRPESSFIILSLVVVVVVFVPSIATSVPTVNVEPQPNDILHEIILLKKAVAKIVSHISKTDARMEEIVSYISKTDKRFKVEEERTEHVEVIVKRKIGDVETQLNNMVKRFDNIWTRLLQQ